MADLPRSAPLPTDAPGFLLPPQQQALAQALAGQGGGNANPSFTDPAYTTLGQIDLLRRQALHNTTEQDPARSWAGVLGNIAQTWGGLQQQGRAETLQKQGMEYSNRAQQPAQGGGGGGPGLLGGGQGATDTPKSLASYYTSQGLPPIGAAALATGQYAESGLRPGIRKVGDGADGSDSVGYGQWNGPRGRAKVAYAASIGKSPDDPQVNRDFTLVELGMKGDPSTPGYGTQLKVRQALMGAQNPQQATAAALAYENPANKPAEYQKRLALTTALVGGGAAAGGAGAGAGGRQPVQVAQAQSPMGPFAGMTPAQASFNSMNPYTAGNQEMIRGMYSPQAVGIPGGGTGFGVVGQGPNVSTSVEGAYPATISTPDITLPTVPRVGPKGPATGAPSLGGGNAPGAGGGNNNPLANPAIGDIVHSAQEFSANKEQLKNATTLLGSYADDGINAKNQIGMMDSFRELGQTIESGWSTRALSVLANAGIPFTENTLTARMQAYQELAHKLGVPGDINVMNLDKGARGALADSVESQLRYRIDRMNTALSGGNQLDTLKKIGKMEPPKWAVGSSNSNANQGNGGGGGGGAGTQPSALDLARTAIDKGAPRDKVIQRLKDAHIDPKGL